jgi:hypothetical protein
VELIVAMAGLILLHVPPVVASVSVTELPIHNDDGPKTAAGSGFTVAGVVTVHPVPRE